MIDVHIHLPAEFTAGEARSVLDGLIPTIAALRTDPPADEPVELPDTVADAWQRAMVATWAGWLGPRVEPRWPNRWRAWVDSASGRTSVGVFGDSELEALQRLVTRLGDPIGMDAE